jgi:hypothetical protein
MALNLMGDFDRLTAFFREDLCELLNITIDVYPGTQSKPAFVQNKIINSEKFGIDMFNK